MCENMCISEKRYGIGTVISENHTLGLCLTEHLENVSAFSGSHHQGKSRPMKTHVHRMRKCWGRTVLSKCSVQACSTPNEGKEVQKT